jgi:hypothetical protein
MIVGHYYKQNNKLFLLQFQLRQYEESLLTNMAQSHT